MSLTNSLRDRVAAEIRAEMARQRKSGVELASLLHLSQQSVSRRVNGETDLTLDELEVVARWLDVSLADIVGSAAA